MSIRLKTGYYYGSQVDSIETDLFLCNLTTYDPDTRIEEHCHDNAYFSMLLNGEYTEHGEEQEETIRSGSVVFRPPSYVHRNQFFSNGGTCFNVELKRPSDIDMAFDIPQKPDIFTSTNISTLYKLYCCFITGKSRSDLFDCLLEAFVQYAHLPHLQSDKELPWTKEVKYILENEYDTFHSLQSVSQRVFVHPVYLARAFKQNTGITFGAYQRRVKLNKSVHLLLNRSAPIHEVADMLGFYDPPHFIRCFKEFYGMSPLQFRQSAKS